MLKFRVFKCETLAELEASVNAWLHTMGETIVVHSHTFRPKRRDESRYHASFVYSETSRTL